MTNRGRSSWAATAFALLSFLGIGTNPSPMTTAAPRTPAAPAPVAKVAFNTTRSDAKLSASPDQELFRGKVVLVRDALKNRKIEASDEIDKQVALETPAGELIPIVPDWRGRAFFQDEHLRNRDVELVGRRKPGVPYLQVLIVFTFDEKGIRQYTDYYCDTCGFPMYELKACECCQGPLRLRFQPRDLPDFIKARHAKSSPAPLKR